MQERDLSHFPASEIRGTRARKVTDLGAPTRKSCVCLASTFSLV